MLDLLTARVSLGTLRTVGDQCGRIHPTSTFLRGDLSSESLASWLTLPRVLPGVTVVTFLMDKEGQDWNLS